MSISTMTTLAVLRAQGVQVSSLKALEAASARVEPGNDTTAAIKAVATYVPTEILTLYVTVIAISQQSAKLSSSTALTLMTAFALITPLVVWLVFAGKQAAAEKPLPFHPRSWPIWEMVAATIAFVAWGFALPDNPFHEASWYSSTIAGVGVLLVSLFLGLMAPLVQQSAKK